MVCFHCAGYSGYISAMGIRWPAVGYIGQVPLPKIGGQNVILANVYLPKTVQFTFLESCLADLAAFAESTIIL